MGFVYHGIQRQHDAMILSTHVREGTPSSKRARSILFMVLWLRSLMELPSGW